MIAQLPIDFDAAPASRPLDAHFNGATYSPEHDDVRLKGQMQRVFDAMSDGHWRTLGEIEAITRDPPASISAQLRHLRKPRFGAFTVERRARGYRKHGLYEYRVKLPDVAAGPANDRGTQPERTTMAKAKKGKGSKGKGKSC